MLSRVLLALLLVAPSSCLRVPAVSRREAVRLAAASAAASATMLPLGANAVPQYIVPIKDDLKILIIKAKELRTAVKNGAAARRSLPLDPTPGVNNYDALTRKVLRAKTEVLEPLRAQFKVVAADAGAKSLLTAELQKQLDLQPLLMQGHMLELDQVRQQSPHSPSQFPAQLLPAMADATLSVRSTRQALKEAKFEAYISKRTGRTYPGGKVERELEEIGETCDDFLSLALGRLPEAGEDED